MEFIERVVERKKYKINIDKINQFAQNPSHLTQFLLKFKNV